MDLLEHNRRAWDREAQRGSAWTTPVSAETIERARRGDWSVILTPNRGVPRSWFPSELAEKHILCLASGGGQQAPVLAAAGATVLSFDLSEAQLSLDRALAEAHRLDLSTMRGDMADLSRLEADRFDLIFHPVANLFVPELAPVWRGCFRVLKPGGALLAGFMNPVLFMFDHDEAEATGALTVRHRLPYSDTEALGPEALRARIAAGTALEHGHSLEAQIGGQLQAGFLIAGLYEDDWSDEGTPLNSYTPTSIATRALRPAG